MCFRSSGGLSGCGLVSRAGLMGCRFGIKIWERVKGVWFSV